jgi:hypothetical protein
MGEGHLSGARWGARKGRTLISPESVGSKPATECTAVTDVEADLVQGGSDSHVALAQASF